MVAGQAIVLPGGYKGLAYDGAIRDLGALAGNYSVGYGMDHAGTVVG